MSQVTEQSVRFQTALASIKLIQASAVLDLTEDDFDFLTSNKVWIATDFFFSSRRRHTRLQGDWSSDVCSSDLRRPRSVGGSVRTRGSPHRTVRHSSRAVGARGSRVA